MAKILKGLFAKYPVLKGMSSYGVIWPTASLVEQTVAHKDEIKNSGYDLSKAFRFGAWGSFFMAPALYHWVKFISKVMPKRDVATSAKKAFIEQVTFSPFSMSAFFFGMSALEKKSYKECVAEVRNKLWETWKISICYWPFVSFISNTYIPLSKRVTFYSFCSLIWTIFLAYMKSLKPVEQ